MTREERNRSIVELWQQGHSDADLARRFGCSTQTIRNARSEAGCLALPGDQHKPRKAMWERRPISALHRQLGRDVAVFRESLGLNLTGFSARACMSHQRLVELEAGVHDTTLSEVLRIEALLGRPVSQLLSLRHP